jgi:hypothetical protein
MTAMLRAFSITLFSLFLIACGGGGSGPNTGTVTVAITDASIDDYDEALLELSSVTLIGAGGQETELLEGTQTIDLLKLRNVSELLLRETVTARTISKIRLGVESITLNKLDLNGEIEVGEGSTVSPPVPTRKIDLNPQGPLEVRAGEDLLVMIDFDLHNSIKINETGNGQIRFRPLVKIAAGVSGLVRLYGTYAVDVDTGDTSICNLERAYDADGIDPLDLCVALEETADTHYFGADGKPLMEGEPNNSGDLGDGEVVSVYGSYLENSEEPLLVADIIARAHSEPFSLLYGIVTSAWDEVTNQFELAELSETEEVVTAIPVVLSEGAKVFNIDGDILDPSAIELAKIAEAQGAMTVVAGEPDFLQAFFAFVSEATGNDSTSGVIEAIDEPMISLMTSDPDAVDCLLVTPTTEYFEIAIVGDVTNLQEINFGDLASGDTIDVSGDTEGDCIQAITVIREI